MRTNSAEPISVLRAALSGPFGAIERLAEQIIVERMRLNHTLIEAASDLGISIEALRRLRADFPRLDRLASKPIP